MHPIFAEFVDGDSRWQVCLADCPDYLSYRALADILYTEHLRGLEHTDILVVRPRVDRSGYPEGGALGDIKAVCDRAPRASVHILYSEDYQHRLTGNLNKSAEGFLNAEERESAFLRWLQGKD
jgi:hypothetical protein